METSNENKLPQSSNPSDSSGESMKDSMTESTVNNDNAKLPTAEELTNEDGELDAEAFKESYQRNEDSSSAGTGESRDREQSGN